MMMRFWLLLPWIAVNLLGLCLMGIDKRRARRHLWRIPERVLFLPVIFGGGIGGTIGMFLFHHKTKHWYFRFFFPLLAVLQLAGPVFLLLLSDTVLSLSGNAPS